VVVVPSNATVDKASAEVAKRVLSTYTIGAHTLVVKFAEARTQVDESIMATVTTLYVSNLNSCVTQRMLQIYFSQWGEVRNCAIALKNGLSKGFAFVEFSVRTELSTSLNFTVPTRLRNGYEWC
jgi:hypothetical protein